LSRQRYLSLVRSAMLWKDMITMVEINVIIQQ